MQHSLCRLGHLPILANGGATAQLLARLRQLRVYYITKKSRELLARGLISKM
jgi:hypothetical protein